MATRPIICPPGTIPGFVFFKDKFVLDEGGIKTTFFNLSDILLGVSAYSRIKIRKEQSIIIMICVFINISYLRNEK